ncbi:hypothetical protein FACS1894105_07430 [Clostridia bacterium]|nr:hypothetical protein FACS1894105_07430 [Clostridia bacterium]
MKKILLTLVPIIREGKIGDAAAIFKLSAIRNADDFAAAYRALAEDTRVLESVTTPTTPIQLP